MKKPRKLKKPKLPKLPRPPIRRRAKAAEEKMSEALSNVPRITNETVAEHREDVLSGARKYIYPLQHSKHHIVRYSVSILIIGIIAFLAYCGLALYKFQTTSGFMYDVTLVLPFPVAKTGPNWVSYESYLFELRRNMHYYQTQQQANFKTRDGRAQLVRLKQQALAQVIQDSYVKQLAAQHHVTVTDQDVNNEIAIVKNENRLGNSDQVLNEVLNKFWGWNESDFKRELKQQLLQQAVVAKLDQGTQNRASSALKQLQGGADFGTLATQISDDQATKTSGGQFGSPIAVNDHNVPPSVTAALFKLKAGQTTGIIDTGYTLEIYKVIDTNGTSLHAAHIQFNLQDISAYVQPLQKKESPHHYIKT